MPTYSDFLLGGSAQQPARRQQQPLGGGYSSRLLGGVTAAPQVQEEEEDPGILSRAGSALGEFVAKPALDLRDIVQQGVQPSEQFPYFRLPESVGERAESTSATARQIAPFAVGGPAGGAFAAGAGGVARRIGGEALGASIADFGQQAQETGQVDPLQNLTAAGLGAAGGAAGEAVGAGITGFLNRRAARDLDRLDPAQVQQLRGQAQEQGVQLTPAELTGLPSLAAQQKLLGNVPGAGDDLGDFYRVRAEEQIEPAVERFLGSISDFQGDEAAGELTRAAATRAQNTVAQMRSDAARPLYDRAFAEAQPVNTDPVMATIKNAKARFPGTGEVSKTLTKVERLLTDQADDFALPVTDISVLHGAKIEIDQMLEGVNVAKRLGRTTQAQLTNVKSKLVQAMDEASPAYGEARAVFADLSPGVARVREGVAGTIADLPDQQLRTVASRLFDKSKISPRSVTEAKRQLQGADPVAWQAIKRSFLEDAWIKAGTQTLGSQGAPVNQGAKFRKAMLGNARQMQNIKNALEPGEFTALNNLSQVLEASGRVKPIGSDTAWNQEVLRAQKSMARSPLSRVIGALNPNVLRDVSNYMDQRGFVAESERLVGLITSPNGIEFLRELKRVSPNPRIGSALIGYAAGVGSAPEPEAPQNVPDAQGLPTGQLEQPGAGGMAALAPYLQAQQEAQASASQQQQAILQELAGIRSGLGEQQAAQQAPQQQAEQPPQQPPGIDPQQEMVLRQQEMQMRQVEAAQQMEMQQAQADRQQALMEQQLELLRGFAQRSERPAEPRRSGKKKATVRRDEFGRMLEALIEDAE